MTKTISAFRINKSLRELHTDSEAFSVFERKDSFVPSFFLVSSNWKAELKSSHVVTVLAEFKLLSEGKQFVKVFDDSLSSEQVSESVSLVNSSSDEIVYGDFAVAI